MPVSCFFSEKAFKIITEHCHLFLHPCIRLIISVMLYSLFESLDNNILYINFFCTIPNNRYKNVRSDISSG